MHGYSQVIHRGRGVAPARGTEVKSVPHVHKEKWRKSGGKITVL